MLILASQVMDASADAPSPAWARPPCLPVQLHAGPGSLGLGPGPPVQPQGGWDPGAPAGRWDPGRGEDRPRARGG